MAVWQWLAVRVRETAAFIEFDQVYELTGLAGLWPDSSAFPAMGSSGLRKGVSELKLIEVASSHDTGGRSY